MTDPNPGQGQPLVSIVTPSFNQAAYLDDTIRSVLAQDYPHIEYIVMDGGSTDGSVEIIRRHADRLAKWRSAPDKGQAQAIRSGFQLATGEILAWLNSDDLYLTGTVTAAVAALGSDPHAGLVYADGLMVDGENRLLDRHYYRQFTWRELLYFSVILQPTVFIRRSAYERVGGLGNSYDLIFDHELWIRVAQHFPIAHQPQFWAVERTHPEAKTVAMAEQFAAEAERLVQSVIESSSPEVGRRLDARQMAASLDAFAARRLIDAGEYRRATRRIWRATRTRPAVGLRYWYKLVQATLSTLGLGPVFLAYRRTRRRLMHRGRRVEMGDGGAVLE